MDSRNGGIMEIDSYQAGSSNPVSQSGYGKRGASAGMGYERM